MIKPGSMDAVKDNQVPHEHAGQPTKYRSEYCDLTLFLNHCKRNVLLPSLCGYAVFLEVAEQTIVNWGKKYAEFLVSLRKLLVIERQTLVNKGLKNKYNSTIAKLLLSANHGVKETSVQEHSGNLGIEIVNYSGKGKDQNKTPS